MEGWKDEEEKLDLEVSSAESECVMHEEEVMVYGQKSLYTSQVVKQ